MSGAAGKGGCNTVRTLSTSEPGVFDYLVVGGGSGGVSSARRAAAMGAKGSLPEEGGVSPFDKKPQKDGTPCALPPLHSCID